MCIIYICTFILIVFSSHLNQLMLLLHWKPFDCHTWCGLLFLCQLTAKGIHLKEFIYAGNGIYGPQPSWRLSYFIVWPNSRARMFMSQANWYHLSAANESHLMVHQLTRPLYAKSLRRPPHWVSHSFSSPWAQKSNRSKEPRDLGI